MISNLSLNPIDSFLGSYFLRAASLARSSFALILRLRPFWFWLSLIFPLPLCCSSLLWLPTTSTPSLPSLLSCPLLLPRPFSRVVSSLELSSFVGVAVAAAVLPLFDDVSFEPIDLCVFWKIHSKLTCEKEIFLTRLVHRMKNPRAKKNCEQCNEHARESREGDKEIARDELTILPLLDNSTVKYWRLRRKATQAQRWSVRLKVFVFSHCYIYWYWPIQCSMSAYPRKNKKPTRGR